MYANVSTVDLVSNIPLAMETTFGHLNYNAHVVITLLGYEYLICCRLRFF